MLGGGRLLSYLICVAGAQYDAYGIGKDSTLATPQLLEATGWKSGMVSTGDSLDHVPKDDECMASQPSVVSLCPRSLALPRSSSHLLSPWALLPLLHAHE